MTPQPFIIQVLLHIQRNQTYFFFIESGGVIFLVFYRNKLLSVGVTIMQSKCKAHKVQPIKSCQYKTKCLQNFSH